MLALSQSPVIACTRSIAFDIKKSTLGGGGICVFKSVFDFWQLSGLVCAFLLTMVFKNDLVSPLS